MYHAYVNIREQADLFAHYVGLELKGRIVSQGFTAKSVAEAIGRSPAAFNRWLNGKNEIPLAVIFEACAAIDSEPQLIVAGAYSRISRALGEATGERPPAAKTERALQEDGGHQRVRAVLRRLPPPAEPTLRSPAGSASDEDEAYLPQAARHGDEAIKQLDPDEPA